MSLRPATTVSEKPPAKQAKAAQTVVECRDVWKLFGPQADRARAAIVSEGLSKAELLQRYNCVIGVAGASFTVERGEIFCIMGLSGSGKSTLVRLINGLIEPTSGSVLIDGEEIGRKSSSELRRLRAEKIGMVFQSFALLPHRNVLDNVAFGLELRGVSRADRERIAMRVLEQVKLAEWAGRNPSELSGGMQQRVGLARALAGDPELLLMDEPFGALDPLIRRQLQDQFLSLSRVMRKTTVFITHDLDEAIRLGTRIAIMRDGQLVQIGTPAEIVRKPADDYVADFVSGLSRLKLLRACDIMLPIAGASPAGGPRARPDSDLDQLVDLASLHDEPILITTDDGVAVGLVDKKALLRGIQGKPADG
ncbi:MAG: betaine/proline/choline family ABC transporter ATP-binding protein [Rhizobiales bacterium]|nr:betaine/proline/choline family ABC transporter ATP-binding protein [Hyphomicrobiales bacterium]